MSSREAELAEGLAHHRGGRFREAEELYRRVLAHDPRNADALHLLGLVALEAGQVDSAAELVRQAIAERPDDAAFYNSLGEACRRGGVRCRSSTWGCGRRPVTVAGRGRCWEEMRP